MLYGQSHVGWHIMMQKPLLDAPLARALLTSCLKHPHPDAELLIHSLTWSKLLMIQVWPAALIRLDWFNCHKFIHGWKGK
jgi:hypothetical protein